jgi:sodium/potassium-transporting ATPase subunit alpha
MSHHLRFEDTKDKRTSFDTLGSVEKASHPTFAGPKAQERRSVDIQSPPLSRPQTRIPIEYRTLSIQVYDSQRFDAHTGKTKLPSGRTRFAFWRKPKDDGIVEDDATFFGKLDLHNISPHIVCQRFNVSPDVGLDSEAVTKRLQRNGKNILTNKKAPYWRKFARYLFGDFCSILWIGVIVFFISWRPLGNPPAPYNLALGIVVTIVILFQATFTAFQDWSAQKIMSSIMALVPENATVLRDGAPKSIPSSELVVGDVVLLSNGQKVPADIRLIKASHDLKFDKQVLTGEYLHFSYLPMFPH